MGNFNDKKQLQKKHQLRIPDIATERRVKELGEDL